MAAWGLKFKVGDLHIDLDVDYDDIAAFILTLDIVLDGYFAQYGGPLAAVSEIKERIVRELIADIDGDDDIDFDDIDEFVLLLTDDLLPVALT